MKVVDDDGHVWKWRPGIVQSVATVTERNPDAPERREDAYTVAIRASLDMLDELLTRPRHD